MHPIVSFHAVETLPLFEQAIDPVALRAAWGRVEAKSARGGFDGVTVQAFAADAEANLARLQQELLDDAYVPVPAEQITIPKGHDRPGDVRVLRLPSVRDKIAQEALRSVLEPRLDRMFLDCSYGYRPGKGTRKAIGRVSHYITNLKRRWVALADIDNFFGSLDHALLVERLRSISDDPRFLRLVGLWLKMGAVDRRGHWHDAVTGVNQGGVISPLLANFYLHPFDEFLMSKGHVLVRYADDFVILCRDQPGAGDALRAATDFLERQLHLRLNANPRPVRSIDEGFVFLGIQFQGDRRGLDPAKLDVIRRALADAAGDAAGPRLSAGEPAVAGPARAITRIATAAQGWRRYYGGLISPGDPAIETRLADALASVVRDGLRTRAFTSAGQAAHALRASGVYPPDGDQERRVRDVLALAQSVTRPAPPSVSAAVRGRKRRHLRSLAGTSEIVVNTPGTFVGRHGDRVVVRRERRTLFEVPSVKLRGITIASHGVTISTDLIEHCASNDVPLVILSSMGKVAGMLSVPATGRQTAALPQLEALHAGAPALMIAKGFVEGKIRNQLAVIKYFHKYRGRRQPDGRNDLAPYRDEVGRLLEELRRVDLAQGYDHARGSLFSIEGRAAETYWKIVRQLVHRDDFPGRRRRGATDLVNSLLNYSYAVLQTRVLLAILRAGLSPHVSFLHTLRRDEPTLAFDLIEEFRAPIVDRTVLALLGRRQTLTVDDQGRLTVEARRTLLTALHARLATVVEHRRRELTMEEVIRAQALRFAGAVRGELRYRPYLARW